MSQPDWSELSTEYDVLVCWHQIAGGTPYDFRFAFRRTVHYPWSTGYFGGGLVSLVDLRGTFHGNIGRITPLRQSVGPSIRPRIIFPTVTLTFVRDGSPVMSDLMTALVDSNHFSDYELQIPIFLCARGRAVEESTDTLFVGVPEPQSVKVYPDRIEFTLSDSMKKYGERELLTDAFSVDDFPDMDIAWENKPVPVLWGNWVTSTDRVDGDDFVFFDLPVVDTGAGVALEFQLCQPMPWGIKMFGPDDNGPGDPWGWYTSSRVAIYHFRAGGTLAGTYGASTDAYSEQTGHFRPHGGGIYGDPVQAWQEGDRFFLRMHSAILWGNKDGSDQAIENPAEIWYQLLTRFAGVPTTAIDSSWTAVRDHFDSVAATDRARRYMNRIIKLTDALEELCGEFGMITYVKGGQFALKLNPVHLHRPVDVNLYPWDLVQGTVHLVADPARQRATGVRIFYNHTQGFHPSLEELGEIGSPTLLNERARYENESYFFQAIYPSDAEDFAEYRFNWLWTPTDAGVYLARYQELLDGGGDPPLAGVEATVVKRLLDPRFGPGDVIRIHHRTLLDSDETSFQIYEMNIRLDEGLSNIKGYAVDPDDD